MKKLHGNLQVFTLLRIKIWKIYEVICFESDGYLRIIKFKSSSLSKIFFGVQDFTYNN